jgi:uncharacterized membrane protein
LWGFLTKLGAEKVPWQTMMIFFAVCTLAGGLATGPIKMKMDAWHLIGLGAGIAGALGFVYFFLAISRGQASTVIPVTSLYVAVASILAFILLSEPLTLKKALGILSAVVAVVLLAG